MAGTGAPDRSAIAVIQDSLFKLLSGISGGWWGGAIPLMVAIIISVVIG